jgi:hypothetical protein
VGAANRVQTSASRNWLTLKPSLEDTSAPMGAKPAIQAGDETTMPV